jgi:hypothetical protein
VSTQSAKRTLGYHRLTARRSTIARAALYIGALSVLATRVDHISSTTATTTPRCQRSARCLPDFVSAVVVTAGLVAPLGRVAGRYADAIRAVFPS